MNKIDVENIKRILLIKEDFKEGGTLSEKYLLSLPPIKLGQLLDDYKKEKRNIILKELMECVDIIFSKYGNKDTNTIILSQYNQSEDNLQYFETEDYDSCNEEPITLNENNKWCISIELPKDYSLIDSTLFENLWKCWIKLEDIPDAEEYFKNKGEVDCRRSGNIGITKNYNVIAFVSCGNHMTKKYIKSPTIINKLCIE